MSPQVRKSWLAFLTLILVLGVNLGACRRAPVEEPSPEPEDSTEEIERSLVLNDVTLEQPDEQGRLIWRIVSERVTYSEDRKTAQVENPEGELFEEGEAVFRVRGEVGEVRQDGRRITLSGNIVARDLRNGTILRGNELVWIPEEEVMTVTGELVVTHPEMRIQAQQGRFSSQTQQLELQGNVRAVGEDPPMQITGDRMTWDLEQNLITSDRPIVARRYNNRNEVTDQARSQQAEINLETNVARLQDNGQLILRDPAAEVTSDLLIWNLEENTLRAEQPVHIVLRQDRVDLRGDQGRMDMTRQVIYLNGNVRAIAQRNDSRLNSDEMTWNAEENVILAVGNVVYQQADPAMVVRGPQLRGTLENQIFVVSGGRVVTEVVPQ